MDHIRPLFCCSGEMSSAALSNFTVGRCNDILQSFFVVFFNGVLLKSSDCDLGGELLCRSNSPILSTCLVKSKYFLQKQKRKQQQNQLRCNQFFPLIPRIRSPSGHCSGNRSSLIWKFQFTMQSQQHFTGESSLPNDLYSYNRHFETL